jgi:hypothetical protein
MPNITGNTERESGRSNLTCHYNLGCAGINPESIQCRMRVLETKQVKCIGMVFHALSFFLWLSYKPVVYKSASYKAVGISMSFIISIIAASSHVGES